MPGKTIQEQPGWRTGTRRTEHFTFCRRPCAQSTFLHLSDGPGLCPLHHARHRFARKTRHVSLLTGLPEPNPRNKAELP